MATTTEPAPHLPAPHDFPLAAVLIFDGECRICRAQVERLARWDGKGRLAFLSLHDPEVAKRYPDLSHDYLMTSMVLVDRQGARHAGAEAARCLSRLLPALWIFAPLLHIPFSLPLWRWLYRQVAARRYLIGGKLECGDSACSVHFKQ